MSANWSRDDCLNHVADKVTIGNVDFDIDCQYELIELQAEMMDLIQPNSWSLQMKDGSTPILASFQQQIDNWRLVTYLQKRDDYRAKLAIPRPPRWTDTTPALAAQIYDVHKSSLPQAPHKAKLIWDKHWHKGNRAKAAQTATDYNEQSICPLCKETDFQQHWIRECQELNLPEPHKRTLPTTRSQYIAMVEGDIRREKRDNKRDKYEKTA